MTPYPLNKFEYLTSSDRYKSANKVWTTNPDMRTIVGHNIGGSVALTLQKETWSVVLQSRTYGAPALDSNAFDT